MSPVRTPQVERLRFELFSTDLDASHDFYTRVMAFAAEREVVDDTGGRQYVQLGRGAATLAIMHPYRTHVALMRGPTTIELVLEVDDVSLEYRRVLETRWPVDGELQQQPWGLTDFRLLDPDGYYWRITSAGLGDQ